MVSWIISRVIVLVFGTLYPAYYSFKAVKSKNVKEYVRWMMYWIVFALYTVVETITDLSLAWFPVYYELKMALVFWLLSPYTRGASVLYRKFLHPMLASKEREIDDYIVQAREKSYETVVSFGRQGLTIAAAAAVSAAVKNCISLDTEQLYEHIKGDTFQTRTPTSPQRQVLVKRARKSSSCCTYLR
ncbi:receptor expression-enhancing protein 3-like isoform X3 [Cyprinus carpio]|uniref:Receptor expression-enhancing protein n=1 Tax=Cyprinus carpio TaxID=7962 RepID=A0A9Q9Z0H6_CYPCA|nr:receptor expression-enhancing protein 3-like isoform X3 [Cyprinus carpio]